MNIAIETLSATPPDADLADLNLVLRDAVEGGASVGFMLPVSDPEMTAFWQAVLVEAGAGKRVVFAARAAGRIIGTVQLALAGKPNSRHRAELQKLLVLRLHRGRGLGTALVRAAESAARARERTLIVLDTSATGNALGVYARCGYTRAGVIPRYACDPDGPLIDTAFYYKEFPVAAGSVSISRSIPLTTDRL
jgi:ribosomal protein S18 acetylase RimI-like enzyme